MTFVSQDFDEAHPIPMAVSISQFYITVEPAIAMKKSDQWSTPVIGPSLWPRQVISKFVM